MTGDAPAQRTLWGQPRGIVMLSLVEMWERFSYYGMRALLILYLIHRLGIADARAATIYGAYTAMVYGFCVFGGWVADRFVGQWRSIVTGAWLILAGHVGLALQDLARLDERVLFIALALIVTGTGLFKPSSTALVGRLYPDDDPRRTTGFHLFYFGINFGGAVSALVCGALAYRFGWGFGLGAAAVGMSLGLVMLYFGRGDLRGVAVPAAGYGARSVVAPLMMVFGAVALLLIPGAVGPVLLLALVTTLLVVGRYARRTDAAERRRIGVVLVLVAAAAIFWSLSEQAGSALNLFADRMVDLRAGPITLSAPQTQSFNAGFILLLTPVAAFVWAWLRRRGAEPGVMGKHVAALLLAGAGFFGLCAGIVLTGAGERVPLGWLVLSYLLQTTGEICLAPTAYAAVSRLAPPPIASLLMGLWLFSISIGNFVGAWVATLVARPVAGVAAAVEAAQYQTVFLWVAVVAGAAGALLALAAPRLERTVSP